MTQDLWFYSRDGEEKVGPTPGAHLRQWIGAGQLTGETLVWRPDMEDWMPIQSVGELRGAPSAPAGLQPAAEEKHNPDTKRLLTVVQQIKGALNTRSLLNIASSKTFWFGVIGPFIVIQTLVVPLIVSRAVSVWAEGVGIEMSVEDWSGDLFDLSATAENAVLRVPGPYAEAEFLSAEAIELDLSLWSGLFGENWAREIRVNEPKIYVERLLSGRWNYQDLMTAPIPPQVGAVIRKNERAGSEGSASAFIGKRELEGKYSFSLTGVTVEQMDLEWVENLPGDSKGGMIQELKTTLFVDDISVTTKNLVGLVDLSSQRKSLLNLEARTGSGKISFSGKANLFFWEASQEKVDEVDWRPTLEGKIYLENVGTNALARLMPDAAIVPEGGTVSGTIDLEVARRQVECYAHLNIRDATFTANQASRFVAKDASAVSEQLADYRANGQYQFSCGGRLGEGTYRPFQAFQTNMIRHGVEQASEEVQALAAVEHGRFSEEPIDLRLADDVERLLDDVDAKWTRWSGLRSRLRNLGSGGNR